MQQVAKTPNQANFRLKNVESSSLSRKHGEEWRIAFFCLHSENIKEGFFVSTPTNIKTRPGDDEIDLVPLLHALWISKKTLIATTVTGVAISFVICAASPEQWTASTYITKPSLFSLYKEMKKTDTNAPVNPQLLDARLYNSIQNDVFYTAMGVMMAKSITLKEIPPKMGKNEPILYIASATATTEKLAREQLQSALDSANTEAIALNLPTLATESNVRAFNALDDIRIIKNKNAQKIVVLGGVFGLILGSLFVIGSFLKLQYKRANRS